ncbi:MAG: ATP-binding cassette domain-containing protein [Lewinella sp.]|nr:ATP-binding cassette domain-containing protein [Lewinella sp.]
MDKQTLLSVNGLYKKFTTSLRGSMRHGIEYFLRGSIKISRDGKRLRKGEVFALHDVNLQLNEHEILEITGMNGSGKTTLVRLISGIYQPDAGSVIGRKGLKITTLLPLVREYNPYSPVAKIFILKERCTE